MSNINFLIESDKTRIVESFMTSGRSEIRKILLVCGSIQIGVYSVFVSGLIAASIYAQSSTPSAQFTTTLLVWPEWIIKPGFAWIGGIFTDKFGRKISLKFSLALSIIFSLVSCLIPADSQYLELYIISRVFVCIMIGAVQVTNYVIVSESVAQKFRTKCLFFLVITDCIGTLFGCFVMQIIVSIDWKMRLLVSAIPLVIAGLFALVFFKIDETPKYMVISNQADRAYDKLLLPTSQPPANPTIMRKDEFIRSIASLSCSRSQRGKISSLFDSRSKRLSYFLLFLWTVQAVVYWGAMSVLPQLFASSSSSSSSTSQSSLEILLLLYVFEFLGILVAAVFSSKISVQQTLVWFQIVSTILLIIVCISMAVSAQWFLSASICGMFGSLTPIWGILFVISTETFSPKIRATGLGLLMSTRIVQGVLETCLPLTTSYSWQPIVYVAIASGFSAFAVIVSWRKYTPAKNSAPLAQVPKSHSPCESLTSNVSSPKIYSKQ